MVNGHNIIMEQSVSKFIGCPICLEDYDTETRVPRLFPGCGHSVCEVCLRSQTTYNRTSVIACSVCKTEMRYNRHASLKEFPINFGLKDLVEKSIASNNSSKFGNKGVCSTHDAKNNQLCFSPFCQGSALNCVACLFDNHKQCSSAFMMDVDEAYRKVKFEEYSIELKKFKEITQSKLIAFNKQIFDLADIFCRTFEEQIVAVNLETLIKNKSAFKVENSLVERSQPQNSLKASAKNKEHVESILNLERYEKHLRTTLIRLAKNFSKFLEKHFKLKYVVNFDFFTADIADNEYQSDYEY
jgi:hypothetical protein